VDGLVNCQPLDAIDGGSILCIGCQDIRGGFIGDMREVCVKQDYHSPAAAVANGLVMTMTNGW